VSRRIHKDRGKRFFLGLVAGLGLLAAFWFGSHRVWPSSELRPAIEDIVTVDVKGRLLVRQESDLRWFLGEARSRPILERARLRFGRMQEIERQAIALLGDFEARSLGSDPGGLRALRLQLQAGDYQGAWSSWLGTLSRLSEHTRTDVIGGKLIFDLKLATRSLADLEQEQHGEVARLASLFPTLPFWIDPGFSLFEIFFWALAGVLANLLRNSVEYLRRDLYEPVEAWVAFSKLAYGPVLTMLLVYGLSMALVGFVSVELRAYLTVFLAFFVAYNSRKILRILDLSGGAMLGEAERAVRPSTDSAEARRRQLYEMMHASTEAPELRQSVVPAQAPPQAPPQVSVRPPAQTQTQTQTQAPTPEPAPARESPRKQQVDYVPGPFTFSGAPQVSQPESFRELKEQARNLTDFLVEEEAWSKEQKA
jgi:hypothetical protein